MYKYLYLFSQLGPDVKVYRNGTLNIYYKAGQLFWNYTGKLQKVDEETVNAYFLIH